MATFKNRDIVRLNELALTLGPLSDFTKEDTFTVSEIEGMTEVVSITSLRLHIKTQINVCYIELVERCVEKSISIEAYLINPKKKTVTTVILETAFWEPMINKYLSGKLGTEVDVGYDLPDGTRMVTAYISGRGMPAYPGNFTLRGSGGWTGNMLAWDLHREEKPKMSLEEFKTLISWQ